MRHHFLLVHQMDKVKVVGVDRRAASTARSCSAAPSAAPTVSSSSSQRERVKAGAIHGDLRQAARERALADFTSGKLPVLVATDVAARGIHVDAVDVVVHYDPPEDHKAYLHRSGRTARAGAVGVAVMLTLWNQENEVRVIQRRLRLDEPDRRDLLERPPPPRPAQLGPRRREPSPSPSSSRARLRSASSRLRRGSGPLRARRRG